jgi:hypothetical protein
MVDAAAHSKVEIWISVRKLVNKDMMSLSDPFVVVFLNDSIHSNLEIGRTEIIEY